MCGAQRHGKLVGDLPTECGGLRKFEVMRVGTLAAADKAGLRSDEGGVTEVADAPGLGEREGHFVDDRGSVTSGDGLVHPNSQN